MRNPPIPANKSMNVKVGILEGEKGGFIGLKGVKFV